MKKLITILLFFFTCTTAFSRAYFVKAGGNDSNDGQSDATAWKTISKVNTVALSAGDIIQFKCGDTFAGTITPQTAGVTYTSYSTGARPIISGLVQVTGWTLISPNIYEATVPGGLPTLNMVVINGVPTPMGRTPNANAANAGYWVYQSYVNFTSITSSSLTGQPNFSGADLVVRKQPYTTARVLIASHVGNTLNFSIPTGSSFGAGNGFFIENSPLTLDQQGEWYYNPATQKLRIFYNSTPPTIQASTINTLVNISNRTNLVFNNLNFQGSEQIAMFLNIATNCMINNCTFQYIGETAIWYQGSSNLTVQGCTFRDVNMIGINHTGTNNMSGVTIQNDTMRNIGMQPGMISKSTIYQESSSSCGINAFVGNMLIQRNVFDSIGYCAIALRTNFNNQIIRNNIVTNYCGVKSDGGGIYNAGVRLNPVPATPTIIDGNIVGKTLNSTGGTTNSTDLQTIGIYLDASSTNVQVTNNTVYEAWKGIFLSQSQYVTVTGNTIYNSGFSNPSPLAGAFSVGDRGGGFQKTRYNRITNNIFFSRITTQLPYLQDELNSPPHVDSIGILDSNYYINTGSNSKLFTWNFGPNNTQYSLSSWRAAYPTFDIHSHSTPRVTPVLTNANADQYLLFSVNASDTVAAFLFPGRRMMDATGALYNNIAPVPRWGSIVLIDSGLAQVPVMPTANAGVDKAITLPTTTTSVTGSGTAGSGASITYLWSQISGPATATIVSPTSLTTTINNLTVDGTYTFKFKVTNNLGDTAIDFMQVVVSPAPVVLPTANAGSDKAITLPVTSTSATATATLGSGTLVSYTWSQTSGPATATFGSGSSLTTTINNLTVAGTYSFQFTVLNSQGNSASDNMDVVVSPAIPPVNIPPTAVAGANQTITLPTNSATVNGSGSSDPDGTITGYLWTITGPNTPTNSTGTSVSTTFGNLIQGVYQARLRVTDNNGDTAVSTLTITVNAAPNVLPTAVAGADQVLVSPVNSTSVDGSGSTDPDGITAYLWIQLSGPTSATIVSPTSDITDMEDLVEGIYIFQLKVTGSNGASDTAVDAIQITVNAAPINNAPIANAGADTTIINPVDSVTLRGSGTDVDGTIAGYLWKEGATTLGTTATITVNNITVGVHFYTLTVTDNLGLTGSDTVQVTALPAPNLRPVILYLNSVH